MRRLLVTYVHTVYERVQKLQIINLFKHGKGLRLLDANLECS